MTLQEINRISTKRYGNDAVSISPLHALWLVEFIYDEHGNNVYKKVYRAREKKGLPTEYPAYGSRVFESLRSAR